MTDRKSYLGDSVYVGMDGDYICLYTDNGLGPTNLIYLEPEVYAALVRYVEKIWTPKKSSDDMEQK